jgi:L-ribulose-5-phosphate 4-epimerase
MNHAALREAAWRANLAIVDAGLVTLTWGNASAADRDAGVMAIKPSGVPYAGMTADQMVLVDIATGEPVEGDLRPSSDAPTHLHLYRAFEDVGGVVHTHSTYATAWAQAHRSVPCLGTTHADHFHGPIPLVRTLAPQEIADAYERTTGVAVADYFEAAGVDPLTVPGALVPGHGPFAWGATAEKAAEHALILEECARMAWITLQINPDVADLDEALQRKHFERKHGPHAYYGQPRRG